MELTKQSKGLFLGKTWQGYSLQTIVGTGRTIEGRGIRPPYKDLDMQPILDEYVKVPIAAQAINLIEL